MSFLLTLLKKLKRSLANALLRLKIRSEAKRAFKHDMRQFLKHAGALHPERRNALIAEIVMDYHVLEKGLTMPRRHLGFGTGKVLNLIQLIQRFEQEFGTDSQVTHAVKVLRAYRELHRDYPTQMPRLNAFLEAHPGVPAAIEPHVARNVFYADKDAPFPIFAASRHVVRHFAGKVSRDKLEKAIALAMTAPSACNRQHSRVHIVDDAALRDQLFAMQQGTRGFGQDADKVIVVTADLSAIRWSWERHDAYVNGGIFVMNLCYSLHYEGIAHCILHWSVSPDVDCAAHSLLSIPPNEDIVSVIACGMPPEEFDVAASPRRDVQDILTWHDLTENAKRE